MVKQNVRHQFYYVYISFVFLGRKLVRSKDLSVVECKNDA